jgi:hypothetical protein
LAPVSDSWGHFRSPDDCRCIADAGFSENRKTVMTVTAIGYELI